jgi:hypothetical protein
MRKDTKLVVDIPGVNEAGSCDKYMKHVKEKWATFDCVVVGWMESRESTLKNKSIF